MLRNEWKDAAFSIAAIGDKEAVAETDGLVVIAAIDPQGVPSSHDTANEAVVSASCARNCVRRPECGQEGRGARMPAGSCDPVQSAFGQVTALLEGLGTNEMCLWYGLLMCLTLWRCAVVMWGLG